MRNSGKNKAKNNAGKKNVGDGSSADGYLNLVSRSGIGAQNQITASEYAFNDITKNRLKLEAMYRTSWLAGKIVDSISEDMTREGITIHSTNEPDQVQKMNVAITRLGIWGSLLDAIKWGRLYGGAIAVINIDGQDPSTPLNIETVGLGQFSGLTTYDRWQLQVDNNNYIASGINAGLPSYYTVIANLQTGEITNIRYHHTRVIRLIGIKLPFYQAMTEMMWGESIIERLYDRLVSFDAVTMGSANLIQKAYYRTVKIDELRQVLAAGGLAEENLKKQWEYMRLLQTTEGLTLIDTKDQLETHSYSFAGLSEMNLQFAQEVSGAADTPLIRLFSQTPTGMNSTGEMDLRMYYDKIKALQECGLREGMQSILLVLHRSLFGSSAPENLDFDFVPLWQTTNKEKADIANSTATTVSLAYDQRIISLDVALKELRQSSDITGIFTNITDEDIDKASMAPPPSALIPDAPDFEQPQTSPNVPEAKTIADSRNG